MSATANDSTSIKEDSCDYEDHKKAALQHFTFHHRFASTAAAVFVADILLLATGRVPTTGWFDSVAFGIGMVSAYLTVSNIISANRDAAYETTFKTLAELTRNEKPAPSAEKAAKPTNG